MLTTPECTALHVVPANAQELISVVLPFEDQLVSIQAPILRLTGGDSISPPGKPLSSLRLAETILLVLPLHQYHSFHQFTNQPQPSHIPSEPLPSLLTQRSLPTDWLVQRGGVRAKYLTHVNVATASQVSHGQSCTTQMIQPAMWKTKAQKAHQGDDSIRCHAHGAAKLNFKPLRGPARRQY